MSLDDRVQTWITDKMDDTGYNMLQGQWNVIQEAAVAATKVIPVATGTLGPAVSTTHPQTVTLVDRMNALLPSIHLECCYMLSS